MSETMRYEVSMSGRWQTVEMWLCDEHKQQYVDHNACVKEIATQCREDAKECRLCAMGK